MQKSRNFQGTLDDHSLKFSIWIVSYCSCERSFCRYEQVKAYIIYVAFVSALQFTVLPPCRCLLSSRIYSDVRKELYIYISIPGIFLEYVLQMPKRYQVFICTECGSSACFFFFFFSREDAKRDSSNRNAARNITAYCCYVFDRMMWCIVSFGVWPVMYIPRNKEWWWSSSERYEKQEK